MATGLNPRKCKHCKTKYIPVKPRQTACSIDCAIALMEAAKRKIQRKKDAQKRIEMKSRQEWSRDAQTVVNKYVRRLAELNGEGCISCGTKSAEVYDAGHYIAVGNTAGGSLLRYDTRNIYLQCRRCNSFLRGNLIEYRKNLVERVGIELVEWLESQRGIKRWSEEDLRAIIAEYKLKLKELEGKK